MLNQVVLIGRLTQDLEIEEKEERKVTCMKLAVQRNYKNTDGVYETDFIPVFLYNNIAENTLKYIGKGDLVGIKGRLSSEDNKVYVVGEKVTFLTSKHQEKEED